MRSYKDVNTNNQGDSGMLVTINQPTFKLRWKEINRVRFIGPVTGDFKSFLPWRYGPEPNNFGPFLTSLPTFTGGTARQLTFVSALADPNKPGDYLDPDTHQSPIGRFYDRVRRLSFDNPDIKVRLLMGGKERGAPLSNPNQVWGYAQGFVLRSDRNNPSVTKPMGPCVIVMTTSARVAFESLLNAEVEGYTGDPSDINKRFQAANVIDPDEGRLLTFVQEGLLQQQQMTAATVNWNALKNQGGGGGKAVDTISRYICMLGDRMPLPRLPDGRIELATAPKFFVPWDDCLRIMDERDMFTQVVAAFEDQPLLLVHAFSDKLDWMPAGVLKAAQVSQGGNGPTGHAPSAGLVTGPTNLAPVPGLVSPTPMSLPGNALPGNGTGSVMGMPQQSATAPATGGLVVDWSGVGTSMTPATAAAPELASRMGPDQFNASLMGATTAPAPAGASPGDAASSDPRVLAALEMLNKARAAAGTR